jgi:hypothetical protein
MGAEASPHKTWAECARNCQGTFRFGRPAVMLIHSKLLIFDGELRIGHHLPLTAMLLKYVQAAV